MGLLTIQNDRWMLLWKDNHLWMSFCIFGLVSTWKFKRNMAIFIKLKIQVLMGFNVHIEFESSYNLTCNLLCRKKAKVKTEVAEGKNTFKNVQHLH